MEVSYIIEEMNFLLWEGRGMLRLNGLVHLPSARTLASCIVKDTS